MASKLQIITAIFNDEVGKVTNNLDNWTSFLRTASNNFKYNFVEQILIYGQRPDATACAEIGFWNDKMHRWVNRGATGIALFDYSGSYQKLRYVFDVSDTNSFYGYEVSRWEVKDRYHDEVAEALTNAFGDTAEGGLESVIDDTARNMVEDNILDYLSTVNDSKYGSFLEELDDDNISVILKNALSASIGYMMMTRCGINADEYYDREDFEDIFNFNTPSSVIAMGKVKEKVKEKVAEKKDKNNSANQVEDSSTDNSTDSEKKSAKSKSESKKNTDKTSQAKTDKGDAKAIKEKQDKPAVKEKTHTPPKVKEQTEIKVDEIKKPRQKKRTAPKTKGKATIKKTDTEKKMVKTVNNQTYKIKQSKRSLENTAKGIKKAEKTVKKTAEAAEKTARKTAEVAKRTKQAAQATAKATVKTAKVAAKAVVNAVKAIVAAIKGIVAIIAAGGVPAVVIIIIICSVGVIGGTCFGVFTSNDETTSTDKTMSLAISELTSEHYANLTAMKESYIYDVFEVKGDITINWKEVLAVYAVKTTSGDNPLEVVTLDDTKMDLLRDIMKDMNKMTGIVTSKSVAETTITNDKNGNPIKTTNYVTKKVLTVSILQLSVYEISTQYNFDNKQRVLLEELMGEEYDDLWEELLGTKGQIIQSSSSFVGTGIFAWPFENNQHISSCFGTRVHPISGEVKTHGGTDIAAPLGTPILAAADGVVVTATWSNSYGYYVKIKHDDTYSTLYAHCSALHVSVGQTVKQGQVIADCGSTGYSTGPHLHFEVIRNGIRVDALMFYKKSFS